jgi:hypothetical protein
MNPTLVSFWSLTIGSLFCFDDKLKTRKPYQKIGECQFSRPGGKHKWIMFRPHPPMVPVQMVEPFQNQTL